MESFFLKAALIVLMISAALCSSLQIVKAADFVPLE
jgi:hypothetical protein